MEQVLVNTREIYLREACKDCPDIRPRVEKLLKAAAQAESVFAGAETGAEPASGETTQTALSERPGTVIGRYRLLQQVGEGGMGAVCMFSTWRQGSQRDSLGCYRFATRTFVSCPPHIWWQSMCLKMDEASFSALRGSRIESRSPQKGRFTGGNVELNSHSLQVRPYFKQ